jgi:hypothetical protein
LIRKVSVHWFLEITGVNFKLDDQGMNGRMLSGILQDSMILRIDSDDYMEILFQIG